MDSESFEAATRALHVKRRSFVREITGFLKDARSEGGLSKERFYEKKEYIERCWGEIVSCTKDCVSMVDNVEDREEIVNELNENLESLQLQMETFLGVETQILTNSVDL